MTKKSAKSIYVVESYGRAAAYSSKPKLVGRLQEKVLSWNAQAFTWIEWPEENIQSFVPDNLDEAKKIVAYGDGNCTIVITIKKCLIDD